jgi:hypothetical protein
MQPMPQAFSCITAKDHHLWSPGSVLQWLASNPFHDKETGVLLGGPGGVRLGLLLILRLLIEVRRMEQHSSQPPLSAGCLNIGTILAYATRCTYLLVEQIKESTTYLQEGKRPRRHKAGEIFVTKLDGAMPTVDDAQSITSLPSPLPICGTARSSASNSPRSKGKKSKQKHANDRIDRLVSWMPVICISGVAQDICHLVTCPTRAHSSGQ